jgi:hypothetical protein
MKNYGMRGSGLLIVLAPPVSGPTGRISDLFGDFSF